MELKTEFEDGTRPTYFQTGEERESRELMAASAFTSRRTNSNTFSVVQGALTNRVSNCGGNFPFQLVHRPARSHSWSNVTDRVLESSTRPALRLGVAIRIRRIERKPFMRNVNNTMMKLVLQ
jgi:hypothetical protein